LQLHVAPVDKVIELENNIYLLKLFCPDLASAVKPGQFVNVKVSDTIYPLLRRPFSIADVEDDHICLMFNIYGEGTKILANKQKGHLVDLIGPLGNGFNLTGDYETAIIIAGGLGAAPFPLFTKALQNKKVMTFIGGRTKTDIITYGLENIFISTDDGSKGLNGNVIDLLNSQISLIKSTRSKLFGCGPTAMLRALKEFAILNDLDCEVSTECAMACGFGICQGCPVEGVHQPDKYLLVCKDGPVFNVKDVVL
jgi:dihydroorotate dehydrogenase electron transfer subunit